MATLAQYNHTKSDTDYNDFLTVSTNTYTPCRIATSVDSGTTESGGKTFYNECLTADKYFSSDYSYFLHVRILRQPNDDAGTQNFTVKLYNADVKNPTEQYIANLTINEDSYTTYTPVKYLDTIDFANNTYCYLKDGQYVTISEDAHLYTQIKSGGKVIGYQAWPKEDGGTFIYGDDESGEKVVGYYSKTTNNYDLSNMYWNPSAPSDYTGSDSEKTVDISSTSLVITDYDLVDAYIGTDDHTKTLYKVEENPAWGDVFLTFTPLIDFNNIVFVLQRTEEDYKGNTRYPLIIFQEISTINNILTGGKFQKSELLKIGVLSHPGLKMFINKEEIQIGGTGMYEVRSGKLNINSFSVLSEAIDTDIEDIEKEAFEAWKETKGAQGTDSETKTFSVATTVNREIGESGRTRTIDGFTVDYMYE